MFTVKINRESIKKNPRAGEVSSVVTCGLPRMSLSFTAHYEDPTKLQARSILTHHGCLSNKSIMAVNIEFESHEVDKIADKLISVDLNSITPIKTVLDIIPNHYILNIESYTSIDFNMEIEYPHETLHHAPLPEYLYEYEDCEVECESCRAKFSYQKLEYDTIDDELGFGSSDDVCPECGHWDCCEWEYEDINKVISEVTT